MIGHHRLVAILDLEAASPVAVGSSTDDPAPRADGGEGIVKQIARDHTGRPVLPGTATAGVIRHRFEARSGRRLPELFGDVTKDGDTTVAVVSSIVVDDAAIVGESGIVDERTRGALDRERDAAAQALLFTSEELPAGTRFSLRFTLDDPGETAVTLFATMLDMLAEEPIRVGSSTHSGFGELSCTNIDLRELTIDTVGTLGEWLLAEDRDALMTRVEDPQRWIEANRLNDPPPIDEGASPAFQARPETGVRFHLRLVPVDPIHSSRRTEQRGGHDLAVMERMLGDPVLAGPLIRGALRARAERIVRTVNGPQTVWDPNRAHRTGGPDPDHYDPATDLFGSTAAAAFLSFSFTPVQNAKLQIGEHVAIDRFTGGASEGKLFRQETVADGTIDLTIGLNGRDPSHAGLLALTLIDLATGDLPLGKGRYRGQGTVRGTRLSIEVLDADGPDTEWTEYSTDLPETDWWNRDRLVDSLPDGLKELMSEWVEQLWTRSRPETETS